MEASHLGESWAEDGDFDSLDDGLQAFREPSIYVTRSNDVHNTVLPTHDGLGTFLLSTAPIRQGSRPNDQSNSKRKLVDTQASVDHFSLEPLEGPDLLISNEKRARIERWRSEQCQALLDEIDVESKEQQYHASTITKDFSQSSRALDTGADKSAAGPTETESRAPDEGDSPEPLWKRLTVSFVRDVIGIDEPLLSVIVGETLPEDIYALTELQPPIAGGRPSVSHGPFPGGTWPDRLLYRIAHDLGLLVNILSPHNGNVHPPYATESSSYAGIPLTDSTPMMPDKSSYLKSSTLFDQTPVFLPTIHDRSKDNSAGHDMDMSPESENPKPSETGDDERLRRERQYWERELDIKMVFRFLRGRLLSGPNSNDPEAFSQPGASGISSERRADAIRRHHPLVARNRRLSIDKFVRQNRLQNPRRSLSNCATESLQGRQRSSLARSKDSTHNYWDLGASIGSGSVMMSSGVMGAWGEV